MTADEANTALSTAMDGKVDSVTDLSLSSTYGQANVTRYGGENRYATAAAIAGALGSSGKAVIVNGENYPDALAVLSYAAAQGIPILFTQASTLPSTTLQVLTNHKVNTTIVIGGEGVVSAAVFKQLPGAARYGGKDRYATAIAIINGLKLELETVYVVTGKNYHYWWGQGSQHFSGHGNSKCFEVSS